VNDWRWCKLCEDKDMLTCEILSGIYNNKTHKINYKAITCNEGCCSQDTVRYVLIESISDNILFCKDVNNKCGYGIPKDRIYYIEESDISQIEGE